MKNFKKVISAVIALAMSVSSLVAVNASSFSDVADTAAYAEAVDVLSALGIVTGYTDGTFKPEGEITRAEAATMIVGALNMAEDAKASAGTSQFADVNTQASWATGYVNIGVAQGFIAGMSKTEFAPQENVTFAQMCKMLDCITGYGDYAANNGGWPTGYVALASQTGISKGISASTDTKLTRGQVAQMLYNALTTPNLGVTEYNLTGNTYEQLDGKKDRDFKTILSDKFDAYVVTATITQTAREESSLSTSKGEQVQYKITSADWYADGTDDTSVGSSGKVAVLNNKKAYVGNTDVANYKTSTGKAIVQYNDDEDASTFIYFAVNSKTETKELEASLADSFTADSGKGYDVVKFQKSSSTSSTNDYKFDTSVTDALIVNGVSMELNETNFNKYVKNATGNVVISKDSTATNWQYITVDYYEVAKISSVNYNGDTTTIYIDNVFTTGAKLKSKLAISDSDIEDGNKTLNVYLKNEAIKATEMQEDDIVAIAFNPTGDADASAFYDIYVSRDTVEGKLSSRDKDDETFTVAGTEYDVYNYSNINSGVNPGSEYTFYLDAFGRIVDTDELASSAKYAILQKYLGSDDKISLVLPDGTMKSYEYDLTAANVTSEDITFASGDSAELRICKILNGASTTSAATIAKPNADIQNRVVKYTLKNSTGKITKIEQVAATSSADESRDEYNASIKRVGNIRFGTSTNVLDASDYGTSKEVSKIKAVAVDSLVDNDNYTAFGWKTNSSSEYASFVVITVAGSTYSSSTRFAVVKKVADSTIENEAGDDVYEITLLYKGEEVVYETENDLSSAIHVGDVIVFTTDADGYIDGQEVLFKSGNGSDLDDVAYQTTTGTATAADTTWSGYVTRDAKDQSGFITMPAGAKDWAPKAGFAKTTEDVQVVFGAIIDKSSSTVQFGIADTAGIINKAANLETAGNGVADYAFASDAAVYSYDRGDKTKYSLEVGTKGSVVATPVSSVNKDSSDADKIYFDNAPSGKENAKTNANYGVALIVNGAIQDMFVMNQK